MTKAIISSDGQIEIPEAMRDLLRLEAGSEVILNLRGDVLTIRRSVERDPDWRTMRGMFAGGEDLLKDLAKDREWELARDDERVKSS